MASSHHTPRVTLQSTGGRGDNPKEHDTLVESFNALALAQQNDHFVGGFKQHDKYLDDHRSQSHGEGKVKSPLKSFFKRFKPASPSQNLSHRPEPSSSPSFFHSDLRPTHVNSQTVNNRIQMPVPQTSPGPLPVPPKPLFPPKADGTSLTMQHALSTPALLLHTTKPNTALPSSAPGPSKLTAPTPPRRPVSSPPSATSTADTVIDESERCQGHTQKGNRCSRRGKPQALPSAPRFCYQHTPVILGNVGFKSRNEKNQTINFKDWIPGYLQPSTRAALVSVMEQEVSDKDVPGFIYVFEIIDPKDTTKIHLKVGRTSNIGKRMAQWSNQCSHQDQMVLAIWPPPEGGSKSLLRGQIKAGEPGPHSHRLERLVHIILADLAMHEAYLNTNFPDIEPPKEKRPPTARRYSSSSSSSTLSGVPNGVLSGKLCECGTVHQEIFSFTRPKSGKFKNHEYDLLVLPIIERMGEFVRLAY